MVMALLSTAPHTLCYRSARTAVRALTRTGALGLTLALLLAGCTAGGSTRPGGYQCVTAVGGCWTLLSITPTHHNPDGHADIPGNPLFASSDLLVTPLTCDAACQSSSGGGSNPPGYIANFMQMSQSSNNWFIRAGYETTPGGTQYFMQYYLGDVNPPYGNAYLGPTHIDSGFTGNYPYATITIGDDFLPNPVHPSPQGWFVAMFSASNYTIGGSRFQPDYVFYGQVVYGTSGATARLAAFTNNWINVGGPAAQALQEDGTPPGTVRTVDHPSDAGWLIHPASSTTGGMFYVSCCQPS
jgi:hypothetical protein